jgi:mRNA-degrading endonuclease toxin of MazEF toxin-antitoxin module
MVWARIVRLGRDQPQAGGPSAAKASVTPPRQGDVYLVAPAGRLRSRFGKPSPCVVVSPDQSNALMREVTMAPLVTGDHLSPFRVPLSLQGKGGHVLLGQMETVPVNRLRRHLGVLDPKSLETVLGGLEELFGD